MKAASTTARRKAAVPSATLGVPAGLSPAARAWWAKLTTDYSITDTAGLLLLETAMRAFDRMTQASLLIDKHGAVVKDRFGHYRGHPAVVIERHARAAMLAALRALNLDVEPLGGGRKNK